MTFAIEAHNLKKTFGAVTALDGVSLRVARGQILGVLGPNGAGKSTVVRILTTLLRPDSGSAQVDGIDVLADPKEVRRRIGLSGQYAAVDETLSGRENLVMFAMLYRQTRRQAQQTALDLLDRFALTDAADRPVKTYSGGMRRRLDLAGALVANPSVLFLDEPTTGLDPRSRLTMWDVIRELVGNGTTLLLTTQYLEEADQLADEILVIDHGRVIAEGTPTALKKTVGGERLELELADTDDIPRVTALISAVLGDSPPVTVDEQHLGVTVTNGAQALLAVIGACARENIEVLDVGVRKPTLDDVFLALTGDAATASTPAKDAR
jgi:ABC-2 type transport system ATP-binding protein